MNEIKKYELDNFLTIKTKYDCHYGHYGYLIRAFVQALIDKKTAPELSRHGL